jgi:hypothetical protein
MMATGTEQGTELAIRDMDLIAKRVAESRLFGLDQAQAFTLMLLAQAEGLPYISAVRRFHIIDGKPSMRADAMQAEFQRHGGIVRWVVTTDQEVKAEFSHPVHQPDPVTVCITLKDLTEKGITSGKFGVKDNWKKFPRQMLRARAISEGVRMVDPGIVCGIYTPEEVGDFGKPIDVEARPIPEHHAINHDNGTGHGSGAYADPEVVKQFALWADKQCEEVNQKWCDMLTDKHGEIRQGPAEIVNVWQLSGHLIKWGRAAMKLNAPEEVRAGSRDKYAAMLWQRDQTAVINEATKYCRRCWRDAKAKLAPIEPKAADDDAEQVAAENAAMDAILTTEAGARG